MNIYLSIILIFFGGDSESFKSRLEKYLEQSLKDFTRFSYEIVSQPDTLNAQVFIDETRKIKLNGNMGYVPITLLNKKGIRTQSVMSLKLNLYKNVKIASKDIDRGECLKSEYLKTEPADVAQSRGEFFSDTGKIASYQARTKIAKGEVILTNMIEKAPIIKKGDQVTAFVIKGNVRIDVDAIARQDGCEDEIISVSAHDKKNFKAKVIDRYSVLILE